MNTVVAIFRALTGLFFDDGALALAILAVVVLAGMCATLLPSVPLAGGAALLLGCLGVLLASVLRASRQ